MKGWGEEALFSPVTLPSCGFLSSKNNADEESNEQSNEQSKEQECSDGPPIDGKRA